MQHARVAVSLSRMTHCASNNKHSIQNRQPVTAGWITRLQVHQRQAQLGGRL